MVVSSRFGQSLLAQPPSYDSVVSPPPYPEKTDGVTSHAAVPKSVKPKDKYVAPPALRSGLWNMPSVEMTSPYLHLYEPTAIATTIIHNLYMQQVLHGGKQPVELVLNSGAEPSGHELLSLAEGMSLLPQQPHISVKSTTEKAGLAALLSTDGLTSMWPQASIFINPSKAHRKRQTNSDVQRERWLNEQLLQMMATAYLRKAGMTEANREDIVKLLKAQEGRKVLNAMQALNEGKNGIISYIKMGDDRGISRTDLDAYFKQKGWDADTASGKKQIKEFIRDADNLYEIPSRSLSEIFPDYALKNASEPEKSLIKRPSLSVRKLDKAGQIKLVERTLPKENVVIESLKKRTWPHLLSFPGEKPASILSNDCILFSTAVNIDSINQFAKAVARLDEKRAAENSKQHIPLFVTSPGGDISAGDLFKDLLKQLRTPVDVIINSFGASAAISLLLSGATGKRLATPHALLMVHESSISGSDAHEVGEYMKEGEESKLRFLAKKTGRSLGELRRDTKQDYWLNPLEALFYGDKGLVDGIIVKGNGVVTRQDVGDYLQEKMDSAEAVEKYVKERLERRRDMNTELDRKFDHHDPFDNVLETLEKVVAKTGHKLGQHPDFLHSGPHADSTSIEHIQVKEYVSLGEMILQQMPIFSKMLR